MGGSGLLMKVDPVRAEALFTAAAAISAPDERAAYLEAECRGDRQLRERVEALLRAHVASSSFLNPPDRGPEHASRIPPEAPGTTIGRYKLLEKIGEGGFGAVYRAEQQHPVRRTVALKILKPGMDSA